MTTPACPNRRFSQLSLVEVVSCVISLCGLPRLEHQTRTTPLDFRLLNLIATVIEACEHPRSSGRGHPPTATIRVLATLLPCGASCARVRPGAAWSPRKIEPAVRPCAAAWRA